MTRDDALNSLRNELQGFHGFGRPTRTDSLSLPGHPTVPVLINEFWTAKQRDAHNLHEVSYRACFKPQLPRFFIERLTRPDDVVHDPFMGRGTTLIEAALLGRVPFGADLNPLSRLLVAPRLNPPTAEEVEQRLRTIDFQRASDPPAELLVFYHPETLRELGALRAWLLERRERGQLDAVDAWIWMVALNRLTGHSAGFFSVYTLPPNQAVSLQSQRRINARRRQKPPRRHVPALILKKTRQLLKELTPAERARLARAAGRARLMTASADSTPDLKAGSVQLVVTSPPFLDTVDYRQDNWLRGWFAGHDSQSLALWQFKKIPEWETAMTRVFRELRRLLKPGGWVAFEVGEVRRQTIQLERQVLAAGTAAGLTPALVLINQQKFTKTANCWGVSNDTLGTNTNRVALFQKR